MRKTLLLHCEDFFKINPEIKVPQMCVYDFMQGMFNSPNKKIVRKMIDNKIFTWIAHQKILDDMPYLGITNKDVLKRNIKILIDNKIIQSYVDRSDNSKTYYRNDISSELINNTEAPYSKVGGSQPKSSQGPDSKVVDPPTQKSDNTSIKDNSINNNSPIQLPDCLNTQAFHKAWSDWVAHKKQIRKKLPQTTIELQIKRLAKTPDDAVQMIHNSIENCWAGLFPLKNGSGSLKKQDYQEFLNG